ncbi:MAG: sodium-dependent bicarbonate transport family permease [Bacteroidota bacterium]|jgi:hypothetical protein
MDLISTMGASLLSPMVLSFALGILATLVKSDLKYPEGMYMGLTIYLLFSIGLKGGVKLSAVSPSEIMMPTIAALAMCIIIPLLSYFLLKSIGKMKTVDAAAIAAHFGSVSAVTFSEGTAFLDLIKVPYEGYMPAIVAIMEMPAILIAIFLAKRSMSDTEGSMGKVVHELFTNKGSLLLIGGILIGFATGKKGFEQVSPLFEGLFRGMLCLFLLEVGLVTGRRLFELKKAGAFLFIYALFMPFVHAAAGIYAAHWAGLSMGGATLFGILCSSASYIAAPAAVRLAIPEANPTYYLTASLAIAFPVNVTIGIPLYLNMAQYIYSI